MVKKVTKKKKKKYDIHQNYYCLNKEYTDYNSSKAVIVPIPIEGKLSYGKGTKFGPSAIKKASFEVEPFEPNLKNETYEIGINTQPIIKTKKDIDKKISKYLKDDKFIISIGGDHSISYNIVKNFKEKYEDLTIIFFDAHADLYDKFNSDKYSHASTARRIYELTPNLIQLGIRTISREEFEFLTESKIKYLTTRQIQTNKFWINEIIDSCSNNIYISLDFDVFDSSIMPCTGTPEPNGLNWLQISDFLHAICKKRNVVGIDFVELSPIKGLEAPNYLAAKLIYKFLGYKFEKELKH
jgi:agmatinase